MTSTESDSPVLKSDTIGRVFTPPARREQLLDEFARSGLSGAKFAALAGIKYPTFAAWAQARRQQRGGGPARQGSQEPGGQCALARSRPGSDPGSKGRRRGGSASAPAQRGLNWRSLRRPKFRWPRRCSRRWRGRHWHVEFCRQPCDMRKAFNCLNGLVTERLG
jgi:hypothetical protein